MPSNPGHRLSSTRIWMRPLGLPDQGGTVPEDSIGPVALVVAAEPEPRERLRRALEPEGCEVRFAADVDAALEHLTDTSAPDVVIVASAADAAGVLHFCRLVRRRHVDLAVLLIARASSSEDRAAALRAGADDYIGEFCSLEEVTARVHALLRRAGARRLETAVMRLGSLELNGVTREAFAGSERLPLTPTEFDLLELHLLHPGEVLERSFIYHRIWGHSPRFASNILEVHVSSLRRKLERDGRPRVLQTVRGVGYVAREPPS